MKYSLMSALLAAAILAIAGSSVAVAQTGPTPSPIFTLAPGATPAPLPSSLPPTGPLATPSP
jgi:hypothetical protein